MAVAHDAASQHGTPVQTGNHSWTHTPVGTPRGVLVFIIAGGGAGNPPDEVTGVTYGGVAMTEVAGSPQTQAAGEGGQAHCYFLGSSIPTGPQTIAVTTSGSTVQKVTTCITMTAGADTEINDTSTINSTGTVGPIALTTTKSALCYGGIFAGRATTTIAPGTSPTSSQMAGEIALGTGTATVVIVDGGEQAAGTVNVDWDPSQSDDMCGIAVAINQAPTLIPLAAAPVTFTGSAGITAATQVPLAAAPVTFAGTAGITAQTQIPLAAAPVVFAGSAGVTAATQVPLANAPVVFAGTAAVSAPKLVALNAAAVTFGGSAAVGVPVSLQLNPSSVIFGGAAEVGVPVSLLLDPSGVSFGGGPLDLIFIRPVLPGQVRHRQQSSVAVEVTLEASTITTSTVEDSEGPQNPTTVISQAHADIPGGNAWTDPGDAVDINDDYTQVLLPTTEETEYLWATGFGFTIPDDATILGVEGRMLAHRENFFDFEVPVINAGNVHLIQGGARVGNNLATANTLQTGQLYFLYGGSDQLWGLSLDPADVNDLGFGLAVSLIYHGGAPSHSEALCSVDVLQLQVTYEVGGEVIHVNGAPTLQFTPDTTSVKAAEFKNEVVGGFSAASFSVPNERKFDPREYVGATARIYEHETGTTWHEGRVVGASDSGDEIGFEIEGWGNHLTDDKTGRWIPYDRDLSRWQGPSVEFLLTTHPAKNEGSSVTPSPVDGAPALETKISGPVDEWPEQIYSDGWYDAEGLEIALVDYAWRKSDTIWTDPLGTDDTNWSWGVVLSTDDLMSLITYSGTLRGLGPSSGTLLVDGARKEFARVFMGYLTPPGATSGDVALDYSIFWTLLAVASDHGLPLQGAVGVPNLGRGLLVSDMVEYIVERWAPSLEIGDIEATTFVVPHSEFRTPTAAMDQIESLVLFGGNSFRPLEWWVEEGRRFNLASPENRGTTYRTSWEEGAEPAGQGPDYQQMLNGVMVTYDDGTGKRWSVGPPGSEADTQTSLLLDTNPDNPTNRDGGRHWETFDAGIQSEASSILIGQVILEERNRLEWRGSVVLPEWIRIGSNDYRPAAELRGGDYVVITDDDDTRPRRVQDVSWNEGRATVNVGAAPDRLETLLARAGVVLSGPVGAGLPTFVPNPPNPNARKR